ncbi:uncharacterized protein LOC120079302 [Benincasa hispida]|uniref:uncharacterized protein LOC120079302 n=1 Tax=Benincasa hispida TaxID=102211 RepID=UPI001901E5BD|nr:uncharacterized protein LOC120079302 [Benincasa hispida]
MVTKGVVLGHKVSKVGLEVDDAKIDMIAKLPAPANIKALRSYLGHAEKKMLVMVFTTENFRAYSVGTFATTYSEHSAIKFLMDKNDAKPRLIRELGLAEIEEKFFDKCLLKVEDREPWYADIVNYLTTKQFPEEFNAQQRKRLMHYNKLRYNAYYLNVMTPLVEATLEDNRLLQRSFKVARNAIPLNNILEVELLDVWGIDFMGPFPPSCRQQYILVVVDYVSKWVEAAAYAKNDAVTISKFLAKYIFTCFGTHRR